MENSQWKMRILGKRLSGCFSSDSSEKRCFLAMSFVYKLMAPYRDNTGNSNEQSSGHVLLPRLTAFPTCTTLLIPKTIGNRKRDCAWGCARGINTTWENLQIEKHKSVRWAERTPTWFVLFDLQIFSGGVYPPSATSRTISFSISNSFWYDSFFRWEGRCSRKFDRFFGASITCHAIWQKQNEELGTVSKSATESVNSAPFKRGETKVHFWQGKVQNSSPILRCKFLARKSAKLIANFSAT